MKRFLGILLVLYCLPFTGCKEKVSSQQKQMAVLTPLNWDVFNKEKLEKLINEYGKNSENYNPDKPPYIVVDWDNTSIFLDIEEATLVYMMQNLVFGASPEQLNEAIRKGVDMSDFSANFNNLAGKTVNIEKIASDIIDSYTWLYNNYKGLHGDKTLEEIKKNHHYEAFISKLRYLYDAVDGTFGHAISYPWATYLFVGMTEPEVRELTKATIYWQLAQPIENVSWTSPASLPGKAGRVSVTWKNGLRFVPEMQNLYWLFDSNGFDIWVCSASFVDVVKEIASNSENAYDIFPDHILAMELERDNKLRIEPQFRKTYDQTQEEGKTKTIKRFLVEKYGYGPIFIAGDSEGDQNMMQDFEDTKLVLIINRLRCLCSDIGKFSQQAVKSYGEDDAKYLLQGRNDNTGLFISSQCSYKLGSKEAEMLNSD
jgi:phosphoserine phosphatase